MKKRCVFAVSGVVLLVALASCIYVYRHGLLLASAMTQYQSRPDFMGDIRWNDERSDVLIKKRFPVGTAESDLINVLGGRGFTVLLAKRAAKIRLQNVPCNELLEVSWNVDERGQTH